MENRKERIETWGLAGIKSVTEGQLASIFENFTPMQQPLRFYK